MTAAHTRTLVLEYRCCPFLHPTAGLRPPGGPWRLCLMGAEGVNPFLVHEQA